MAVLLSGQGLDKSFSARPLFTGITLGIEENERLGLIGPNGAGKSTLLKVLAGLEKPDDGAVSVRKGLRVGYVAQEEAFPAGASVESVLESALAAQPLEETERAVRVEIALAHVGFTNAAQRVQTVDTLSGGWRKRLAIARALIAEPDLLLLDEPTNHLDLEGVLWLEALLADAAFAFVVVSHDRYFLENVAERIVELNPAYPDGYLSSRGGYSDFVVKRADFLSGQAHEEQALASQVRREIAWLRRGARARTTKAKGRIEAAAHMIGEFADLKARNVLGAADNRAGIGFSGSGRRSKELIVATQIEKSWGGRTLFSGLDLVLTPGAKLGLVGANGSGKTSLLRVLAGELSPDKGTIRHADGLKIVVFDQNREQLEPAQTLKDALCPQGETVSYRGQSIHVASWARRFLFRPEQLAGTVGRLSGGEQARVLVARLMLRPADVLILDEPTNDLDIPTLDVLEESLQEFPGALVLVSHDRFLLDAVSTQILVLNESGSARLFADYAQWEESRRAPSSVLPAAPPPPRKPTAPKTVEPARPGLSSAERRELAGIEAKIEAAETRVATLEQQLADPVVASDHERLQACWNDLAAARALVSPLYARWEELEARASPSQR